MALHKPNEGYSPGSVLLLALSEEHVLMELGELGPRGSLPRRVDLDHLRIPLLQRATGPQFQHRYVRVAIFSSSPPSYDVYRPFFLEQN